MTGSNLASHLQASLLGETKKVATAEAKTKFP